jgi:hypothetical protein
MNKKKFAKGVERLVNPIDVELTHFIRQFNSILQLYYSILRFYKSPLVKF